ncbi:hypothetical protein JJL53_12295 [Aeromonas media]|uniref:hypothetical protein n=1 Tax=Aeromonas media TaxID=651 RepID=UPI001913AFC5|nr:hypothetical protein [Aeromonas media]QQQ11835.1 hypothetical protein JJL53_12295 [Aeromonas media]
MDYHQGDYRDHDNAYPQAWYRDQGIYWVNKSRTELVKVSDDFSQDIKTIIYGETASVTGNGYRYSNSYEFESRGGDDAPYTCDIKETVSTTVDGKKYELVNLANGEAQVFADCVPEDLAGAITHRYATAGYKDAEADYSSQFVYFLGGSNSFPFLNDWIGMADDHATRNMSELVAAFEQLPYRYDDKTAEPEAAGWVKNQTITDSSGVTTKISYDEQGRYRKFTVFANGTHTEECGTDGITWGECIN